MEEELPVSISEESKSSSSAFPDHSLMVTLLLLDVKGFILREDEVISEEEEEECLDERNVVGRRKEVDVCSSKASTTITANTIV